jgi:hypothetical protein
MENNISNKKEVYEAPISEIIVFETQDVITASGDITDEI